MSANKEEMKIRQAKVLAGKAEGKSYKDIGEDNGTSEATAWRDWQKLKGDASIVDEINNLKYISLSTAMNSASIEDKWLKKHEDGDITPEVAGKINAIKVSSVKIYSGLQGVGTDDKGGETIEANKITFTDGKGS